MRGARRTAIIVGLLFIVATAASVIGAVLIGPILAEANYLSVILENTGTYVLSVLFFFLAAASIAGIPIMLFPVFRKYDETMAFWFLGARFIEAVIFVVGGVFSLSLVSLAREFGTAIAPDAPHFLTLGAVIRGAADTAYYLGTMIFFSLSAVILSVILYRTNLVPRWLSIWTFIGAVMLLVLGFLKLYGVDAPTLEAVMTIPIAVNEMVLAVWLIVKGFNTSALDALSAKAELNN
jgi:hypothetical protein